jgi:hypothetical protein
VETIWDDSGSICPLPSEGQTGSGYQRDETSSPWPVSSDKERRIGRENREEHRRGGFLFLSNRNRPPEDWALITIHLEQEPWSRWGIVGLENAIPQVYDYSQLLIQSHVVKSATDEDVPDLVLHEKFRQFLTSTPLSSISWENHPTLLSNAGDPDFIENVLLLIKPEEML